MEENLTKLFELNKTLIIEKDEIRKKLFEKCIISFEGKHIDDSSFLYNISREMKDKDYENLRIKYQRLKDIIYYINQLEKKEV